LSADSIYALFICGFIFKMTEYYKNGNRSHHKMPSTMARCGSNAPYHYERKKIRHFTMRDLERITRYVQRDEKSKNGLDEIKILVRIARVLGMAWIFCKFSKVAQAFLSISHWVHQLTEMLAVSTALKLIIEKVKGSKMLAIGWLKWVVIIAIVLDGILNGIEKIARDMAVLISDVDDITELSLAACHYVHELEGVAYVEEKTDGVLDNISSDLLDAITDGNLSNWQDWINSDNNPFN
jgi:hypothetical protein